MKYSETFNFIVATSDWNLTLNLSILTISLAIFEGSFAGIKGLPFFRLMLAWALTSIGGFSLIYSTLKSYASGLKGGKKEKAFTAYWLWNYLIPALLYASIAQLAAVIIIAIATPKFMPPGTAIAAAYGLLAAFISALVSGKVAPAIASALKPHIPLDVSAWKALICAMLRIVLTIILLKVFVLIPVIKVPLRTRIAIALIFALSCIVAYVFPWLLFRHEVYGAWAEVSAYWEYPSASASVSWSGLEEFNGTGLYYMAAEISVQASDPGGATGSGISDVVVVLAYNATAAGYAKTYYQIAPHLGWHLEIEDLSL